MPEVVLSLHHASKTAGTASSAAAGSTVSGSTTASPRVDASKTGRSPARVAEATLIPGTTGSVSEIEVPMFSLAAEQASGSASAAAPQPASAVIAAAAAAYSVADPADGKQQAAAAAGSAQQQQARPLKSKRTLRTGKSRRERKERKEPPQLLVLETRDAKGNVSHALQFRVGALLSDPDGFLLAK